MIKKLLLIVSVIAGNVSHLIADPLIVAVLMVKNEEPVVVQTLQPLVEGGIDAFLLFDTGSTDATIEKAREYLQRSGITKFHIAQEPFVDFSTSRNRALYLAEEHFPHADFMIMPDAEWRLHNVEDLLVFCNEHCVDREPGYLIRIVQNGALDYYNCRLIRCRSGMRFKCPVHEHIEYPASVKVPKHIFFEWNRGEYGSEKSAQRWIRDRDILLKSYHENPRDPRTVFYLAQTYSCLNDQEKAYLFYQERIRMGGWAEETYETYYRMAEIVELLAVKDSARYNWSQALDYYLKAYAVRSNRAEPLIKIAQYYLAHDNHALAFLFANRALSIPYPEYEALFIEKSMYTYARYDIVGRSAWYIGQYERGEEALRQALKENPGNNYFNANLSFYLHRNIAMGKYGVKKVDIAPQADSLQGTRLWSILICTITERKDQLEYLIAKLKNQIHEHGLEHRVEILVFEDNRDCPIGLKRNKLIEASTGVYVNFIDDDDEIHEHYIKMIYDAMQADPDCVGLLGIRTENGYNPQFFIHSIEYDSYFIRDNIFYRPPNHLNPIKREKICQFTFPEIYWREDDPWALAIAQSGCLKTEKKIMEPYYFYKYRSKS